MNVKSLSRREFLGDVGRGMMIASVGYEAACDLGLAHALAGDAPVALNFGSLEPLVALMQETPADKLLPALASRLAAGTPLKQIVTAGALANARTFGGEDYVGFHTMMAMAPSFHMAQELPSGNQALPVFKVLYRNTARIQEFGGRKAEVLHEVQPQPASGSLASGEELRNRVRGRDVHGAEELFAGLCQGSPEDALNQLLFAVHDNTEVHRIVLPYRAWDLVGLIGRENAQTLLRQSIRYCVKAETWPRNSTWDEPRKILPQLLDQHKLLGRAPGDKKVDDKWVDEMSQSIFKSAPTQAAAAVAAALEEGIEPAALGEAMSLAANQLILRDQGRTPREESPGKPVGSVHGDSIGVHACDSANAWRNLSRVTAPRNCFASLILGAYQVALDRVQRGGDFLHWQPLPVAYHLATTKGTDAASLVREAEEAIRGNLQARAAAVAQRYGELGLNPRPLFDLMLKYAISEDGSLHAEKFYRTTVEEFHNARPAFQWRYAVALARVTASEYGRPAAGMAEARALLKV